MCKMLSQQNFINITDNTDFYAHQIWFTKKIMKEILTSPKSVKFFHDEMATIKSILWGKTH